MAKEKDTGFQQAAGLIRYFDAEEETNIKFDPRVVLGVTFAIGIAVILLNVFAPFN